MFRKIILPEAMLSILLGVCFSLPIIWLTLIVTETLARHGVRIIRTDSEIGYMTMNTCKFMQTDVVVLIILLYPLLGKLTNSVARVLEKAWLQWNPNHQQN